VDDINRLVDVAPGFVWRLQIADGQLPVLEEASERLECLRELGPSARAFTFKQAFDPQ
jgi:hypothetical protein